MATAALPGSAPVRARARALLGVVVSVVTTAAGAAITPHKAALRRLADIPLTLAGTGCIDFAAFHIAHGWGWLVTGISLILLEHLIADDDDQPAGRRM